MKEETVEEARHGRIIESCITGVAITSSVSAGLAAFRAFQFGLTNDNLIVVSAILGGAVVFSWIVSAIAFWHMVKKK